MNKLLSYVASYIFVAFGLLVIWNVGVTTFFDVQRISLGSVSWAIVFYTLANLLIKLLQTDYEDWEERIVFSFFYSAIVIVFVLAISVLGGLL